MPPRSHAPLPSPARTACTPAARRPGRAAVALVAAALVLGACGGLTDTDMAASVGDVTLEHTELDELIVASTPDAVPGERVTVPLRTAQDLLNTWILTEILRDDLARGGVTITDEDRAAAEAAIAGSRGPTWADGQPESFVSLQVEQQAVVTSWGTIDLPEPTEDELRATYERGSETSGIACTAHILVESADDADRVVAALDGGADFAVIAAERSIDSGSAVNGGVLPCASSNEFAQTYIPEYVEAAFAAPIGVPTDPVQSEFGYHVIVVRPFDDVVDEGIADIYNSQQVRFRRASRVADVRVDPRYGAFDPDAGVVTLG